MLATTLSLNGRQIPPLPFFFFSFDFETTEKEGIRTGIERNQAIGSGHSPLPFPSQSPLRKTPWPLPASGFRPAERFYKIHPECGNLQSAENSHLSIIVTNLPFYPHNHPAKLNIGTQNRNKGCDGRITLAIPFLRWRKDYENSCS
jgi:hypothetical protein